MPKIEFINARVIEFTAHREAMFRTVDGNAAGRRFATNSQTQQLIWPRRRTRAQVAVQHLCTAHANSGYIMAAHLALDADAALPDIEAEMTASGNFGRPRAFRQQARVWSQTEFEDYLNRITQRVAVHPLEAPDVDLGLQLPHQGTLVRQNILQMAYAFYLLACLGRGDERFVFVLDSDPGLALSFISAFAMRIRGERADVLVVRFDKHKSNDQRNVLVADGKAASQHTTGLSASQWKALTAEQSLEITDLTIEQMLDGASLAEPFDWPFLTKSEPNRSIRILTDRLTIAPDRRARLMRLATRRSLDA